MDDSGGSLEPIARLKTLREFHDSWHKATWKKQGNLFHELTNISIRGYWQLWDLAGGVFGCCNFDSSLHFVQLPSRIRGIQQREWKFENVGFAAHAIAIDPSQDLLVVAESINAGNQEAGGIYCIPNLVLE